MLLILQDPAQAVSPGESPSLFTNSHDPDGSLLVLLEETLWFAPGMDKRVGNAQMALFFHIKLFASLLWTSATLASISAPAA